MPFFKRDGENVLASSSLDGPGYSLREDAHAEHTYPVDGWVWADSLDAALPLLVVTDAVPFRFGAAAILASGMLGPDVTTPSQMDAAIEAVIASLPISAAEKAVAVLSWRRATEIRRDNPLVAAIAQARGLSEADVDAMFAAARAMQAAEAG